jgi:predicted enzyme related to lactoylglutathione lyase
LYHTIVHFDIPANDVEKLSAFYRKVFDWKIEKAPGPVEYWLIETVPADSSGKLTAPGVNGGMMKRESPEQRPTNYITVESVDEYAKKVEQNGGRIIVPKQEVSGMGYFAVAVDPEGNQFAIWETKE